MKFDINDCLSKLDSIQCELRSGELCNVENPYFSVVIPTYKRVDLLKEAIDSAINQSDFDKPYEIIVVDNDDCVEVNDTEAFIKELDIPNLYYYKNMVNLGACGNWNRCVMLARSKWVVMCHDDDLMKPNCLSVMARILDKHRNDKKQVGYIRPSGESFYSANIKAPTNIQKTNRFNKSDTSMIRFTYNNVILGGGCTWAGAPTCGTLINRDAFISVGGYNQELSPCPDCYVPYHMLKNYGVYKTCHSLGFYRWGENDTYRKPTLIGLISAYNEFLEILSQKHFMVRLFSNEHFANCALYYCKKGKEADVNISIDEINKIRNFKYSKFKLKVLLFIRKAYSAIQNIFAR